MEEVIKDSKASIEKEDLAILLRILAEINPKYILEIGTWKGFSAQVWHKAFSPIDQLITIERDQFEYEYQPNNLHYIRGDSHQSEVIDEVKKWCDYDKIDFLFIDGDHSYEGVKKDWEMYGPLVQKGGIVAFHDALYHADKTEEVDILWKEVKDLYNHQEIKAGPNSTGIGVLFL